MNQQVRDPAPTFKGLARPVLVSAAFFMAVTGLAYPFATMGAAGLLFPHQAGGSLLERGGATIGSAVIGQDFKEPRYFHPRPSATLGVDPADPDKSVDQPYNAASSGASNLGPTSRKLIDQVTERTAAYRRLNGLAADAPVPADAVTASGSGLDPHISLANAQLQVKRVAQARGLKPVDVQHLLEERALPRQLGLLGEPRVNVLDLNMALDAIAGAGGRAATPAN